MNWLIINLGNVQRQIVGISATMSSHTGTALFLNYKYMFNLEKLESITTY